MKRSHIVEVTVFLALAGLFLVFLRPAELGGDTRFMVVYGGSMRPAINVGDLAIVKHVDPSQIRVGDIITFYRERQFVTHRVVEVLPNGDFATEGDANDAPDMEPVSRSQVIGRAVFLIPYVGYVLHYAGTFWGLVFLVWIPAAALIAMEVRSILGTKSPPIMCDKYGKWKDKLEKYLQTHERITLLALGNVKLDVLRHIRGRGDIEIVKLETRYMKRREKGMGLKLTVRKRKEGEGTDDRGPDL